jgi:hypothetical protein
METRQLLNKMSTINAFTSEDLHLMRSRRIDRPYRRKQHASLHGMFNDPRFETEALFVHFQNRSHPAMRNARRPSINTLHNRYGVRGETSAVVNKWNAGNHEGPQIRRHTGTSGLQNLRKSTTSRSIRV